MFSNFNTWPEGSSFSQSSFDELVNVDDQLMGAYMQTLLNDQGARLGNAGLPAAAVSLQPGQPAVPAGAALPPVTSPFSFGHLRANANPNALTSNHNLASLPANSLAPFLPLNLPLNPAPSPALDLPLASLPSSLSADSLPLPTAPLSPFPSPSPHPTNPSPHPATNVKSSHAKQAASPTDDAMAPMDAAGDGNGQGNSGDTNSGNSSDPSQPGGKRRRVRTAKQQVLNKLAQQRYRERRRQRYDDLQKTVDTLTEQVASLQTLQRENRQLATANEELRTQLQAQQQELANIRLQLQASSAASGICSAANSAAAKWDYNAIRTQLAEKVVVLRRLLGSLGCLDGVVKPSAALPQESLVELKAAVTQYCQTCMQLMCAKKPHMAGRMAAADWKALVKAPEDDIRVHWESCLQAMNLNEEQKSQLLQLKQGHMRRLRALYDERQRLNLTAMGLMLPHPLQGVCADTTPDGKLKCVGARGQLFCIGHDLDLHKVLDDIKGNLREEQKGVVELNYMLVHRILDTVQAARLLVQAFPCNIDSLAIAIVLESTMDPEDVARLMAPPPRKDSPPAGPNDTIPSCDSHPNDCGATCTGCNGISAKAASPQRPPSPHLPITGRPCCSASLPSTATACS